MFQQGVYVFPRKLSNFPQAKEIREAAGGVEGTGPDKENHPAFCLRCHKSFIHGEENGRLAKERKRHKCRLLASESYRDQNGHYRDDQ